MALSSFGRPSSARAVPAELDSATLHAAQRGQESSCRALYRRYESTVFGFLRRMCGPHEPRIAVEDLVQETFLRVFRGLPRFRARGPAKLSTWILTIAYRVVLNEARTRRIPTVRLDEKLTLVAPERTDQAARQHELARCLADALARLDPEQRAVFLLREYHGMSYQEIASTQGIDAGTVKSRLFRSRRAVRLAVEGVLDDV